jgi:isoquinoline 1-oxidoreductase subunit alpha
MPSIRVNGTLHDVDVDSDTPLLWVLRDTLGLTGTKYGCGMGLCGACTVHLDGKPVRSCQIPLATVGTQSIVTIDAAAKDLAHPLFKAWLDENVVQCGYCMPGQLMSALALHDSNGDVSDAAIDTAMAGNICRCGSYSRIKSAIVKASQLRRGAKK